MKIRIVLFLILGLLLALYFNTLVQQKSLNELSDRFILANTSEDMGAMLSLYALEGIKEKDLAILKTALSFEIGLPIQSISFQDLTGTPEESIAYQHQGIQYKASLVPKLRMVVEYAVEGQLTSKFSIGQNPKKEWQIITAIPDNKK